MCGPPLNPCLLLCDLVESRREEGRVAERALLILVIWDKAAVAGPTVIEASSSIIVSIWNEVALAGPTVIEASSSIIVSICIHAQFVLCIPITASH